MADAPNTAGAAAGQATNPAQTATPAPEFTAPEGKTLLDTKQFETFKRYEEQVKGLRPYHETGSRYGFTKPEDFQRWAPVFERFKGNPTTLLQFLTGDMGGDDPEPAAKPNGSNFDPAKFRQEMLAEFKKEQATSERKAALAAQEKSLDAKAKELAGEGASDKKVKSMRLMLEAAQWNHRSPYGDDHPLAGALGPLGEEGIAKVAEEIRTLLTEEQAEKAAAAGDAANAAKGRSTAAGAEKAQGGKRDDETGRTSAFPTEDEASAAFDRILKRTGGRAVSG